MVRPFFLNVVNTSTLLALKAFQLDKCLPPGDDPLQRGHGFELEAVFPKSHEFRCCKCGEPGKYRVDLNKCCHTIVRLIDTRKKKVFPVYIKDDGALKMFHEDEISFVDGKYSLFSVYAASSEEKVQELIDKINEDETEERNMMNKNIQGETSKINDSIQNAKKALKALEDQQSSNNSKRAQLEALMEKAATMKTKNKQHVEKVQESRKEANQERVKSQHSMQQAKKILDEPEATIEQMNVTMTTLFEETEKLAAQAVKLQTDKDELQERTKATDVEVKKVEEDIAETKTIVRSKRSILSGLKEGFRAMQFRWSQMSFVLRKHKVQICGKFDEVIKQLQKRTSSGNADNDGIPPELSQKAQELQGTIEALVKEIQDLEDVSDKFEEEARGLRDLRDLMNAEIKSIDEAVSFCETLRNTGEQIINSMMLKLEQRLEE